MATAANNTDDPWYWSVDRVVQELCVNSTQNVTTRPGPLSRDPYEAVIRDNEIDGEALLMTDKQELKDGLGIVKHGPRMKVWNVIESLRRRSTNYQIQTQPSLPLSRYLSYPTAYGTPSSNVPNFSLQSHGLPPPSSLSPTNTNDQDRFSLQTPFRETNSSRLAESRLRPPLPGFADDTAKHSDALGTINDEAKENDRLVLPLLDQNRPEELRDLAIHGNYIEPDDHNHTTYPSTLPRSSDPVVALDSQNHTKTEQVPKKDRKRIAPTFVRHSVPVQKRRKLGQYLSEHTIGAEHIFYGNDEPSLDVSSGAWEAPGNSGASIMVAKHIHHCLQQSLTDVPGTFSKALVPYRAHPSIEGQQQYFTLFTPKFEPEVENAVDWPQVAIAPKFVLATENLASDDKQDENIIEDELQNPMDDFDALLARYPPGSEDDQGYALLGESGSEGDLDDETWQEYQEEEKERSRLAAEARKGFLSHEEVEAAIKKACEDIRTMWAERRFPKVQLKGHRLWMQTRRQNNQVQEIETAEYWCKRHHEKVLGMCTAILSETWTKPGQVMTQCQVLEEALCQELEHDHFKKVLESDEPPTRPDRLELSKKIPRDKSQLAEDEELLESDEDEADDDMDDFIELESASECGTIDANGDEDVRKTIVQVSSQSVSAQDSSNIGEDASSASMDVDSTDGDDQVLSPSMRRRLPPRESLSPVLRTHGSAIFLAPTDDRDEDEHAMGQSAVESEEQKDSDLDKPTKIPNSKYRYFGTSDKPITFGSSPPSSSSQVRSRTTSSVHTPCLNTPTDHQSAAEDDSEPMTADAARKKLILKVKRPEPEAVSPSTRPGRSPKKATPSKKQRRAIRQNDIYLMPGIAACSWDQIEDDIDHRRALAKAVYEQPRAVIRELQKYFGHIANSDESLHGVIKNSLEAMQKNRSERIFGVLPQNQKLALLLARLAASYKNARRLDLIKFGQPEQLITTIKNLESMLKPFREHLRVVMYIKLGTKEIETPVLYQKPKATLSHKSQTPSKKSTPRDIVTPSHRRPVHDIREQSRDDSDDDLGLATEMSEEHDATGLPGSQPRTPGRIRKKAVADSQEALQHQKSDRQRVLDQQRRREAIEQLMRAAGAVSSDSVVRPINVEEPLIFLDEHINSKVKEHQVKGIQFLWRELVADNAQQGCLLAHTMGLGKTMQVISFLVTLQQAAQSLAKGVRKQIPKGMRQIRALILCPPSLIENWLDEIMIWSPGHQEDYLGQVRPIVSTQSTATDRMNDILAWAREGGVLIIGYEIFRKLIENNGTEKKPPAYGEADYELLKKALVDGPNIIIADEAHKMKNVCGRLAEVTKQFRSKSRIALTGSPLANNIIEYFAMVDWIAPAYLGNLVQFKANYAEPIAEGLYMESSSYQRRRSLIKLQTLKRVLEPKINRADITAIAADMPKKTEFFITLPLKKDQAIVYNNYVESLRGVATKSTSRGQAALWQWINSLTLLCNHPYPFYAKLSDRLRSNEAKVEQFKVRKSRTSLDNEDLEGEALPDVDVTKIGLEAAALRSILVPFDRLDDRQKIEDASLSYRSQFIVKIIECANAVGDKVLVFSHGIPTLDYLESLFRAEGYKIARMDGSVAITKRQQQTKDFNTDLDVQVFLISTRAGGLGLNLQGANRVVIFDFGFNPSWEEQAIGRSYRLGQEKPVYVYRFRTGGTFQDSLHNSAIFKTQLAARVVDKKNFMRAASRDIATYLRAYEDPPQGSLEDIIECAKKDPNVLEMILSSPAMMNAVRDIVLTETFQKEEDESLDAEGIKEVDKEFQEENERRENPAAYKAKLAQAQTEALSWPSRETARFANIPSSYTPVFSNPFATQPSSYISTAAGVRSDPVPPSTAPLMYSNAAARPGSVPIPWALNAPSLIDLTPTSSSSSSVMQLDTVGAPKALPLSIANEPISFTDEWQAKQKEQDCRPSNLGQRRLSEANVESTETSGTLRDKLQDAKHRRLQQQQGTRRTES